MWTTATEYYESSYAYYRNMDDNDISVYESRNGKSNGFFAR
jgi:hypothetical protein